MKKNGIAPTLKGLKLYEQAEFPRERGTSVRSTIQSLYMATDAKYATKQDKEKNQIVVTRIK